MLVNHSLIHAGGNFYAGRRVIARLGKLKASMVGGGVTVMRNGGEPVCENHVWLEEQKEE